MQAIGIGDQNEGCARAQRIDCRPGSLDLILLLSALLLSWALRLHRLGDQNIWWDEGYAVHLARTNPLALALETAGDSHPPLYYWLFQLWIWLVGESEFAMRLLSVCFALITVALVYWLGRRSLGRRVGLLAAFLLATSRLNIEWSQEIKMYTLAAALAVVSIALTLALWRGAGRRAWIAYLAVTALGLYTHYVSGIVPLVESLATGVLWLLPLAGQRLRAGFVVRWVGAQVAALALFLPWIALFLAAPWKEPNVYYPNTLLGFLRAGATAFGLGVSAHVERYTPFTLIMLALLILSLPAVAARRRRQAGLLLYMLLFLPPLLLFALSRPNPIFFEPNLSVRYLLIFLPVYCLLIGAALSLLWTPTVRLLGAISRHDKVGGPAALRGLPGIAAAAFVTIVVLWSLADYYPRRRLVDNYQSVLRYLEAYERAGEAILLNSNREWPVFAYRYKGGLKYYGIGSPQVLSAAEAERIVAPLLARHGSLWVLTSDGSHDADPEGHLRGWLEGHARLVVEVANARRHLALYSTEPSRSVTYPTVVRPARSTHLAFADRLTVVGYDLPVREVAPGEDIPLAVYWRPEAPLTREARARIRLVDRQGRTWRETRVKLANNGAPWQPGRVVRSDWPMRITGAVPPGRYTLALAVTAGEQELRPNGLAIGSPSSIETIQVLDVGQQAAATAGPQHRTSYAFGGKIQLLGYDLSPSPATGQPAGTPAQFAIRPAGSIRLRLHWQAIENMDRAYTVFVQLVGESENPATGNRVWAQRDTYPQNGLSPTDLWSVAREILDDYELVLPGEAPSGRYLLLVGFYDLASGQRLSVSKDDAPAGDAAVIAVAAVAPQ